MTKTFREQLEEELSSAEMTAEEALDRINSTLDEALGGEDAIAEASDELRADLVQISDLVAKVLGLD
jgi:hypothetical protein